MEMGMAPNVSRSTGFLNFYIFFGDHFLGHIAGAVFHIPLWSSSLFLFVVDFQCDFILVFFL